MDIVFIYLEKRETVFFQEHEIASCLKAASRFQANYMSA